MGPLNIPDGEDIVKAIIIFAVICVAIGFVLSYLF
jgi:hypothetical protein